MLPIWFQLLFFGSAPSAPSSPLAAPAHSPLCPLPVVMTCSLMGTQHPQAAESSLHSSHIKTNNAVQNSAKQCIFFLILQLLGFMIYEK